MDDEIAPILLILAAPDELGVEVAVAPRLLVRERIGTVRSTARIGHPYRGLLVLAHHRLVFGRRDVLAGGLIVSEGLDVQR
ncbi:hypothetical protein [Thiocapsa roseopersicina]|uniref:hypothetical protein n=1 Tax=Thiocapsa roseopersicina TaxID=1058 RepID=UPI001FDEB1F7|nr:hypothetical protein [Thiocapsa roseopersicina]